MDSRLTHISKEISYALRHAPWEYELELDEQGFVPIVLQPVFSRFKNNLFLSVFFRNRSHSF